MKNLLKLFISMFVILYFTGCEHSVDAEFDEAILLNSYEGKASANNIHGDKMVTLGFNLVFTGNYEVPTHAANCDTGTFPVRNVGEGTGTHFKKVTSLFEFCVRPTPAGGGTYPEGYVNAYFEDEDGDQLFVYVEGEVIPGRLPGMPSYALSYFKDPFTILDGTGKFKDATGGGFTNDFNFLNKDDIQQTSHHWQGTITMRKGKN
ncbi:MAG: hypothetical protein KJN76_11505 [Eudoraea sp.]|nr:hypothetical protein [Eudoraea sp.]